MLKKPSKVPLNFSSLFDGGILKSSIVRELFNILNLRRPKFCISGGQFLTLIPFQIDSVSLSPKVKIITTAVFTYAKDKYFIYELSINLFRYSFVFLFTQDLKPKTLRICLKCKSYIFYFFYYELKNSSSGNFASEIIWIN